MADPSLINLISDAQLNKVKGDLITSTVVALQQLKKIVTAETARSVRGEVERGKDFADIDIIAGGGMKYIIEGKPPNTKLPMKKVGGEFVLFDRLKDWKNIIGFDGSDFVLARAIAKNERKPVDVAGKAMEIYNKLYAPQLSKTILTLTSKEVADRIKKA